MRVRAGVPDATPGRCTQLLRRSFCVLAHSPYTVGSRSIYMATAANYILYHLLSLCSACNSDIHSPSKQPFPSLSLFTDGVEANTTPTITLCRTHQTLWPTVAKTPSVGLASLLRVLSIGCPIPPSAWLAKMPEWCVRSLCLPAPYAWLAAYDNCARDSLH